MNISNTIIYKQIPWEYTFVIIILLYYTIMGFKRLSEDMNSGSPIQVFLSTVFFIFIGILSTQIMQKLYLVVLDDKLMILDNEGVSIPSVEKVLWSNIEKVVFQDYYTRGGRSKRYHADVVLITHNREFIVDGCFWLSDLTERIRTIRRYYNGLIMVEHPKGTLTPAPILEPITKMDHKDLSYAG